MSPDSSKVVDVKPRQTRRVVAIGLAVLALLVLGWLVFSPTSTPATKTVVWRLQPDQFPLGTVLQGSQFEMSLGVLSGLKPPPTPSFIARLPSSIQKPCQWGVETFRSLKAKSRWRLEVEAPDFLKVNEAEIQLHSVHGPFAFVSLTLKTVRPGRCSGNLQVRLSCAGYAATNIIVPVSATVEAAQALAPRRVLIAATPYECFATEDGRTFEPLASLTSRLAAKGISVNYRLQSLWWNWIRSDPTKADNCLLLENLLSR